MPDPQIKATYWLFSEGGAYRVPTDSMIGDMMRPMATSDAEGRISSLETFYDFFINDVANPREAKKFDPDIDQKIRMHPDVRAAMAKREKTVASYPERFDPNPLAPDQKLARELANEIEWAWKQIPNIQQLYVWLEQAALCGGTGVEFAWHREASGIQRPVKWYPVHQSRFSMDRLGNMALRTRYDPAWGAYVSPNPSDLVRRLIDPQKQLLERIDAIPGKFMYHVYRQEAGTWDEPDLEGYTYWGIGEDVALYYPVVWDWLVLRMRMKWLESYGDPPIDIFYPESMDEIVGPSLKKIASKARFGSVNTLPKTPGLPHEQGPYEIIQRDVPSMSYDAFASFSDGWAEKRINKVLLGHAEASQKSEKGAFSEEMARQSAGPQVFFTMDAKLISNTISTQFLPAMFRARFPNAPLIYCPIHVLEPKEERDRKEEVEILEKACAMLDISRDEAYERLGYRTPNPSDELIQPKANPMDPAMGAGDGQPGSQELKAAIGQKADSQAIGQGKQPPKQRTMPRGDF